MVLCLKLVKNNCVEWGHVSVGACSRSSWISIVCVCVLYWWDFDEGISTFIISDLHGVPTLWAAVRWSGPKGHTLDYTITIKKAVPTKFVLRPDHGDASWLLRMQYSLFEILVSGDIDSPCGQVVMTALCFFGIGSLDLVWAQCVVAIQSYLLQQQVLLSEWK